MARSHSNDPELDDFLQRVENLDSRRTNRGLQKPPPIKRKPIELTSSYNDENEEDEDGSMVDVPLSEDSVSNLAYRSAYNYEKTFSPKKSNYSLEDLGLQKSPERQSKQSMKTAERQESKTFTVSEEDYYLLQRLKSGKIEFDEREEHLPSRGKPREKIQHSRRSKREDEECETDSDVPSLPPRKPLHLRDEPLIGQRKHTDVSESSSEGEPPSLPTRPSVVKETEEPPSSGEDIIEYDSKKISLVNLKPKPEVISRRTTKTGGTNATKTKPDPPRKRIDRKSDDMPTSFLTSLEHNKLTTSNVHELNTSPKLDTRHIDYLDSVQLKTNSSPKVPSRATKPGSISNYGSPKRIPRSESFINSALKSKITTTASSSSPPQVPIKKHSISSFVNKPEQLATKTSNEDADVSDESETSASKLTLNALDESRPKVPTKKKELLDMPKLASFCTCGSFSKVR